MTQPDIALAAECEGCVCRGEMSFDEACSQIAFLTMTATWVPLKLQLFFLSLDKENRYDLLSVKQNGSHFPSMHLFYPFISSES